jgi:hypothetical protein
VPVREYGVMADSSGGEQLVEDLPGEEEMRGMVAMDMPDLLAAELERELAAATVT